MSEVTVEDVLVKLEALFIGDGAVCTTQLANELQIEHQKVVGLMKSIQAAGDYVSVADRVKVDVTLKPEGEGIAKNGSHEFVFWSNVPEEGITQGDAMKSIPNAKLGMGKALAAKWISKNKEDGKIYRAVQVNPNKPVQNQDSTVGDARRYNRKYLQKSRGRAATRSEGTCRR